MHSQLLIQENVEAKPTHAEPLLGQYLRNSEDRRPFFIAGDALTVLHQFPSSSVDFCMTSPPYWGQREYSTSGIGLETNWKQYVDDLCDITLELKRVLKPTGSFWLNIGDSYSSKSLLGIPWRVALTMTDEQGWILRNSVIWHKVKGGLDNTSDKLRNVHEHVFHFVRSPKYYYDTDAVRSAPNLARVENGAVISATGVSGIRYKRQIELSTALSSEEKFNAFNALEETLGEIRKGELNDFRMIIRGQQRTTHSDSPSVSGRAREVVEKGFYFLKYHPNGSKPKDVWDIMPEDTQGRLGHFAPYPADLCKIPLLSTCPPDGIVLDPFCGTGTTMLAALHEGRKSIGIDIAEQYLEVARERCHLLI
jgi:site-specific DNA-methyltransferase (adenine-specific)